MIDLNDRRLADLLVSTVDRIVEQKLRTTLPTTRYGTVVGAPDTEKRTVAVALLGKPEPSPGFVFGEVEPVDGDFVRVVISPRGDRYVDAVMGRTSGFSGIIDRPLATDTALETRVDGTTRLVVGADGLLTWNADTNLYRSGVAALRTDDAFSASSIAADGAIVAGGLLGASSTALSGDTTPTVNNGGTATYSARNCRWIKIGRLVVFQLSFGLSATGSGASTVTVTGTGLPESVATFTAAGDRGGTGVTRLAARMVSSGGELTLTEIRNLNGYVIITGADLASGASYGFMGAYLTL